MVIPIGVVMSCVFGLGIVCGIVMVVALGAALFNRKTVTGPTND